MIQPISGPPPGQPPGQGDNLPSGAGNQPLSSQQRTSLESLMTKVTSLTQQQRAELWAGIRHDIGLSGDSLLLSRHFPAAEYNLAQRLLAAQKSHSARQLLAQLGEYLRLGNNRQAVTDYIRHNFGQTPLNQLSPEQLKTILTLLQEGKMVIPQPQQREATDRPLLPAGHNALKQLVTKLAAATGEPSKQIWQSMLELSGVKDGELIPAKLFNHLVTWLQARQTLSQQNTPTLESLQMALKQPLDASELAALSAYIQCSFDKSSGKKTITLSQNGYNTVSYTISIANTAGDLTYAFPEMISGGTQETTTQVQVPTVTPATTKSSTKQSTKRR